MTWKHFLPLVGFVLPTVVMGYGFVIARSCIAGVNELTIGFGTTLLGACVTYASAHAASFPAEVYTFHEESAVEAMLIAAGFGSVQLMRVGDAVLASAIAEPAA